MIVVQKCQSANCINGCPPSKLECPTCNKLGIPGSVFCTQECFKANCKSSKSHKAVHDLFKSIPSAKIKVAEDGTYNPFPSFSFTGSVRPVYPLGQKRIVPNHIPRPEYILSGDGIPREEIKARDKPARCLGAEEIAKMRVACRYGREILDLAASHIRPGITTDAIDEIVHNATIERNAYPSPLGYRNYPKSYCSSVNEVICHGIPDGRVLQEGDIVNIGVHADLNATYPVGNIDENSRNLITTARKCLDEAIKICKPGALIRNIGNTIEPVAKAGGCVVFRDYVGHGINSLFHTVPDIPHYAKNKAAGTMKPGMVFTIEPMINSGRKEGTHWPDDWTCTTQDGRRSAQFEETLLITETGVEILTAAPGAVSAYP
ncbi:peptidase M24, structural domain-containing protein [Flagelloscypha sp. PMI_526]|nr:peptidase M24, structural domain-containing protein [Flagelloscypha sp. PMI_526]